jgi:hypothetical protein
MSARNRFAKGRAGRQRPAAKLRDRREGPEGLPEEAGPQAETWRCCPHPHRADDTLARSFLLRQYARAQPRGGGVPREERHGHDRRRQSANKHRLPTSSISSPSTLWPKPGSRSWRWHILRNRRRSGSMKSLSLVSASSCTVRRARRCVWSSCRFPGAGPPLHKDGAAGCERRNRRRRRGRGTPSSDLIG